MTTPHAFTTEKRMKILGGSFGVSGSAKVTSEGWLIVNSTRSGKFTSSDVASVLAKQEKHRKFGWTGAIIGGLILLAVLGSMFGPIGALLGVVLAIAGSFYSQKSNSAEITFVNGDALSVEGTGREINMLVGLRSGSQS
jgi:hypothetical protein